MKLRDLAGVGILVTFALGVVGTAAAGDKPATKPAASAAPPPKGSAVEDLLKTIEPDALTPKQALDALYELKKKLP